MAFTPYVCLLALLATGICALVRQWPAAILCALAAGFLIGAVAPRAIGGPDTEAEGRSLRVMTSNTFRGTADAAALAALVRERRVDVLALQELTPRFAAELESLGVGGQLPHSTLNLQRNVTGSGIYSRYPVREELGSGDLDFKQIQARLRVGAQSLEVASAHPLPPSGRHSVGEWKAGFAALPTADAPGEQLVLGDFNATLDQERMRELIGTGYADSGDRVGEGLATTWPANKSWPPEITIDHILLPEAWAVRDYEVLDIPGSDHRPVYAELVIPR